MNRRLLVISLMSIVAASFAFGASEKKKKSEKAAMTGDEQAVAKLEQEWAAALVKVDFSVIDRIVSPDWMLTTPDGNLITKAQADADLKSGTVKFDSFTTNDVKVKIHGDTALVFGLETEKSSYKGQDMSGQYRFTDVFVKRDGKWQCVATHVTKVMKPQP